MHDPHEAAREPELSRRVRLLLLFVLVAGLSLAALSRVVHIGSG